MRDRRRSGTASWAAVAALVAFAGGALFACSGSDESSPSSTHARYTLPPGWASLFPAGPTPTHAPYTLPPDAAPSGPVLNGTTAGFDWRVAAAPAFDAVMAVPNGYVLFRPDNRLLVYTSTDGVSWTRPPNPAIFENDGLMPILPQSRTPLVAEPLVPALGRAGYVLADDERGVWISADGVHWRDFRRTGEGDPTDVRATRTGYLATDPWPRRLLVSDDGTTWAPAPAGAWRTLVPAEPGAPIYADDENGKRWVSVDGGSSWVQVDGPVIKLGESFITLGDGVYASPDIASLKKVADLPFYFAAYLVELGGRAFASASDGQLWASEDGLVWERVVDASGRAVTGEPMVIGGRLFISYASSGRERTLTYVGTPDPGPAVPLVPVPSPVVWPSVAPTPSHPTPSPSPTGGISRNQAIAIAAEAIHATPDEIATVDAHVWANEGRWEWDVLFWHYYWAGTAASGTSVAVDFFTGEVLGTGMIQA